LLSNPSGFFYSLVEQNGPEGMKELVDIAQQVNYMGRFYVQNCYNILFYDCLVILLLRFTIVGRAEDLKLSKIVLIHMELRTIMMMMLTYNLCD